MDFIARFKTIEDKDKEQAVAKLIEDATPDFDFFYLTILSVLMATFGLLAGSETIVIGSMLLAPIMSPILALALGLSMSNHRLVANSSRSLLKATAISIGAATIAAIIFSFGSFGSLEVFSNATILVRTHPSLLYFAVAIIAGLAATYAAVQPHLSSGLIGVAVAVALMPPLAVVGIGVAHLSLSISMGALVMYAVNVAGIIFASMLSFSLMDVHAKRKEATNKLKQEEQRVLQEEQKIEEAKKEDDE